LTIIVYTDVTINPLELI